MRLTGESGQRSLHFNHERVKYRVILRADVFTALPKRCIGSGEGQRANKKQEEGRTAEGHVVLAYTHTHTHKFPFTVNHIPFYRSTVRQLKLREDRHQRFSNIARCFPTTVMPWQASQTGRGRVVEMWSCDMKAQGQSEVWHADVMC